MRDLPLYPDGPAKLALSQVEQSVMNHDCNRCVLHTQVPDGHRCWAPAMPGEGAVLWILLSRLNQGDHIGGFGSSRQVSYVRALAQRLWNGPVVVDFALRCPISRDVDKVEPEWADQCATYTARVLHAVRPARVIACGNFAIRAFAQDAIDSFAAQGGFGWLTDEIPVFFLGDPDRGAIHPGYRPEFERALITAITAPLDALPTHPHARKAHAKVLDTATEVLELIRPLQLDRPDPTQGPRITYDVESRGKFGDPDYRLLTVGLGLWGTDTVYIVERHLIADPDVVWFLRTVFDSDYPKCAQNGMYDMVAIREVLGFWPRGHHFDTQYTRRMLFPERLAGLDAQSILLGQGGFKREQANDEAPELARLKARDNALKIKRPKGYYNAYVKAGVRPDALNRYNGRDVIATGDLGLRWSAAFDRAPDRRLHYDKVVEPAIHAFAQITHWGVWADKVAYRDAKIDLSRRLEEVEPRLRGVDAGSHDHVRQYLFGPKSEGFLGLEVTKDMILTPTGLVSTKEKQLAAINKTLKSDVIDAVLETRGLSKLRGTYVDGFLPFIRADGRFHMSVMLDGTETGRPSGREPALMTLPRPDNPDAALIRGCIAPECAVEYGDRGATVIFPDFPDEPVDFLQADYSQIELRIAGMLAGDTRMRDIFASGVDYHMATAEMLAVRAGWVTQAQWDEWTEYARVHGHDEGFKDPRKPYRSKAKAVNFGLVYGKTAKSLAEDLACTEEEAQAVMDAIFGGLTDLSAWLLEQPRRARREGGVWTWWEGRKARWRPIPDARLDPNQRGTRSKLNEAARQSVNTPVQGTASDFTMASIGVLVPWIQKTGFPARLVLSVYDSILFEVPRRMAPELARHVRGVMQGWDSGGFAIRADFEHGRRLNKLTEFAFA